MLTIKKRQIPPTTPLVNPATQPNIIEAIIGEEIDPEMKQAYSEMLDGCKQNPNQRIWYAIWNMQLNDGSATNVGDLSFKGLDANGIVEIGYGIKKAYEGMGYMTEAVTAMARWASKQMGVKYVEAETDPDNRASQRVLEKAGFIPNGTMGLEGPRYVLK